MPDLLTRRPARTARCPVCGHRRYLTQTGPVLLGSHNRHRYETGRLHTSRCPGSGQPTTGGAR